MIVSGCCNRGVYSGTLIDYPLGGRTWSIAYKVDVCESCGKEVEEYEEACDNCGLVSCDCDGAFQ